MSTLVSLIPEIEKSRIRADVRAGIKDKKSRVIHGQEVGGRRPEYINPSREALQLDRVRI